jgi:hypothetical protein
MQKTLKQWLNEGATLHPLKSHPWSRDKGRHWQIHASLEGYNTRPVFSNLYDSYDSCQKDINHLICLSKQK